MNEQEFSESGSPIFRYEEIQGREFKPANGDLESIELISGHIEKYVGEIETVIHEIVSDIVHIDLHWVKPTEKFPFHTLVTSGISDLPMNVPVGYEVSKYLELCILLPKDWKVDGFSEDSTYWPIRCLKTLARFPHEYDTFLGYGHTVPNDEDAEPFSENTKFGCMLLLPSLSLDSNFFELKVNDGKTINFYCLYPLYKEEMDFKLKYGTDKLIDKFERFNVSDVVDINRKNTCLRKGLFGLW